MRSLNRCLLTLLFIALLCVPCTAADMLSDQAESFGVEDLESSLPEAAEDVFDGLTVYNASDVSSHLEKLWTGITNQSHDLVFSALRGASKVLLTAFLAAFCGVVADSAVVSIAGAAAVALISFDSVSSCAAVGREALENLIDFSHVLLPCLATAAAAGGAITSAGAKYAASVLFLDGLASAERNLALPLLCTYAAVLMAGHLTDHPLLLAVSNLLRQGTKWTLILLTTVFTVYLSVTGILSGTVDASAAKAAKSVLSGALPVVGGILSDVSAALLSGAQMLRNGVGVFGLLAVLAVCAVPYLTLGSHYLVFTVSGHAVCSFGDSRIGGVVKGIAGIYGMLLGMVGSVSLMLFVSVVSLMKAVTPG